MNFSLIGSRCYELQSKLRFCNPNIIYKIAFRSGFVHVNQRLLLSFCGIVVRAVQHYLNMPDFKFILS